jgi:flagellar biogenesis protein FliO
MKQNKEIKEKFVTQAENDTIVKNVFSVIGYSIATILMVGMLSWGYITHEYLFVAIFSFVFLIYTSMIVAFIVINKEIYDADSYSVILGTTIISMFLTFIVICIYIYKYFVSIRQTRSVQDIKYSMNY